MTSKNLKYQGLMKSFGKAVRFYRNKLGLSQEGLADRADLDRSYMSQIERGIKNATLNSIWRISQALEVAPSVLLRLTEEVAKAGDKIETLDLSQLANKVQVRIAHGAVSGGPILIVDDDSDILAAMDAILKDSGYDTRSAASGFDAFWIVSSEPIQAVVSDIRMANGNGMELLDAMRKHFPEIPMLFMTGFDDMSAEEAMRRGARGLLSKPFEMTELLALMKTAVETKLHA